MIPEETIAAIRERVPIEELVGEHVTLKKSGASYRGLCPFHNEKTPSFYVHPHRGFYHCFGCQASGDIFSFAMHVEGQTFPEVTRMLAERAGVELPAFDPQLEAEQGRKRAFKERLTALMDAATEFYVRQLSKHANAGIARVELKERGITAKTAKEFRLGYAPSGWDSLLSFLNEQGYSPADAEAVGLIVPRRNSDGHYDRFRHRLMFPITDLHGRVIAFSGRALAPPQGQDDSKEPPAKYINSPESPLYTKGEVLFGLHEARVSIRREGFALLCEGNFDLLALHQAGFSQAVAPLGTAFTEAHAKLLGRFCDQVVLLFDGDAAGRKAAREAHTLVHKAGLSTRVVVLPDGADPDTFLREHGAEALTARVSHAPSGFEYLIDDAAARAGGDAHAKATEIAALGPILAEVDSPIERRLYVERVARKFEVSDLDAVRRELRRGLGRNPQRSESAARQTQPKAPTGLQSKLISVLLDQPELVGEAKELSELLTTADLRAIFESILRMVDTRGGMDTAALLADLETNSLRPWVEQRLVMQEYSREDAEQVLRDGVPRLAQQNIERELPLLQRRIVEARREGDDALAAGLTQEFVALSRSAHKLKQGTTNKR